MLRDRRTNGQTSSHGALGVACDGNVRGRTRTSTGDTQRSTFTVNWSPAAFLVNVPWQPQQPHHHKQNIRPPVRSNERPYVFALFFNFFILLFFIIHFSFETRERTKTKI